MSKKVSMPPLTVKEVALQLGVSEPFVRRLCVSKQIQHIRFGHGKRIIYRFQPEWVDQYVASLIVPVQGGESNG